MSVETELTVKRKSVSEPFSRREIGRGVSKRLAKELLEEEPGNADEIVRLYRARETQKKLAPKFVKEPQRSLKTAMNVIHFIIKDRIRPEERARLAAEHRSSKDAGKRLSQTNTKEQLRERSHLAATARGDIIFPDADRKLLINLCADPQYRITAPSERGKSPGKMDWDRITDAYNAVAKIKRKKPSVNDAYKNLKKRQGLE